MLFRGRLRSDFLPILATLHPQLKTEDLKQYMRRCAEEGKLPKYGVPEHYRFVPEIAKTSVGKLNKKQLRQTFAE
jgi:fatty-acyl-CoA synthase